MKQIISITDKDITGSNKLSAADPRIAVGIVLFDDDNNIALSHIGIWDVHMLPGGGVDPGENLHIAVKREAWEETGCRCEIVGELGKTYQNSEMDNFVQEKYHYIARVVGEKGELHLEEYEIASETTVRWYPLKQALQIILDHPSDDKKHGEIAKRRDVAVLKEALIWQTMHEIPEYDTFVKVEPIEKGWSDDKKYYIETTDGRRMFLRVSDIKEYERKKAEYKMVARVYEHGVLVPQSLGFGVCNGGKSIYSLSGWLDGKNAEESLPFMSETDRYVIGMKSGELLRKIHLIPVMDEAEEWAFRFDKKLQHWFNTHNCKPELHSETGETIVRYLKKNRNVFENRPLAFIHGDYNTENIIILQNGDVGTIDFNNFNTHYADPWWDLNNTAWMPTMSPYFYTGQIRGYFNGEPPTEFWDILTYYLAYDALAALTDPYGLNGIEDGTEIVQNILTWTNNFKNLVPQWYLKDFHVQWIDGIAYKMKAPFDFSFISKYGKVFKVFDNQGSGNICFGVSDGDKRYFIKFAGARTEQYISTVDGAIERLKMAVPVYQDNAHPALIRFIKAEDIGGGFAVVFEWVDAWCMHVGYPEDHRNFKQLPLNTRLRMYEDILLFHAHAASKGYNAYDFYDASIMWDYINERVVLCDIDFYSKSWYKGSKHMWNDPRWASPEECTNGATIDEISTVYNMGGAAFALFSEFDQSPDAWPFNIAMYYVVKKAISDERTERQQSIKELINEWRSAKE
jgi:serine/threonine-protein kinase